MQITTRPQAGKTIILNFPKKNKVTVLDIKIALQLIEEIPIVWIAILQFGGALPATREISPLHNTVRHELNENPIAADKNLGEKITTLMDAGKTAALKEFIGLELAPKEKTTEQLTEEEKGELNTLIQDVLSAADQPISAPREAGLFGAVEEKQEEKAPAPKKPIPKA